MRRPRAAKKRQKKPYRTQRRTARRRAFFWPAIRFVAYWSSVGLIWAALGLAGVVVYFAADLPQSSTWQIPQRAPWIKIVDSRGALLAFRGKHGGEALALDAFPTHLKHAVIAIEDRRYYRHFGIDPIAVLRAIFANLRAGRFVEGASTITQQLVKNLFLTPERSLRRKVQEAVLALWLEFHLSKDQILEMYLNRVYLGSGAFGMDSAARAYFGKSARDITLTEAALLAALLKAPSKLGPHRNPDGAQARALSVLTAMHREGYITAGEAVGALSAQLRLADHTQLSSIGYVADWVAAQLPDYLGAVREDIIVTTTLDKDLQAAAQAGMQAVLFKEGRQRRVSQGAIAVLAPGGAVRALIGGADYRASGFNRALYARRQPGSAFKPFVYLAALEQGLHPATIYRDELQDHDGWQPRNFDHHYRGNVVLADALALSLNTVAAAAAHDVGLDRVIATARRLGVTSPLGQTHSVVLGTFEMSPMEIATAYLPFVNGGHAARPHIISEIRTASGTVLYRRPPARPDSAPAIDARTLRQINLMMAHAVEAGTGHKARLDGHMAGGKTGTSQNFRDAWFVGYTGRLAAAIWLGNDDNSPMDKVSGGDLPARLWQQIMSHAHAGLAPVPLSGLVAGERLVLPARDMETLLAQDGTQQNGDGQGDEPTIFNPIAALIEFFGRAD